MTDNDERAVRFIGALCAALGLALLVFTILISLFAVFAGVASNFSSNLAGLLAFGLSLAMSSALMSCGLLLARVGKVNGPDTQTLRLNWTALVLVMVLGITPGAWLSPHLAALALFILFTLVLIRNNIRNLTS